MSLDRCIPIPPVTGPGCIPPTGTANCNTTQIPTGICPPPIDPGPEDPKCVNDNARRPWPTPPPAEIGCNPVSLQITNEPTEEDDPDQTIRLEGSVTYISGDACLPQVNLNLVVPPSIASGGGSPSLSGFGYTQYGGCVRVGPVQDAKYATPQDFFSNEPGAAAFVTKTIPQMNQLGNCDELCQARSKFGSQVAKFNLIGPILAEITGFYPAKFSGVDGDIFATGWQYSWTRSVCVIASNMCQPLCNISSWSDYDVGIEYSEAWNIKENVYGYTFGGFPGFLTPGINLQNQVRAGFKPVPIMLGTQVLIYGFVPWGVTPPTTNPNTGETVPGSPEACECPIVWFFSEQVAFDGECKEEDTGTAGLTSMLPQRNITSAGMFFGSPENANRV